MKKLICLTLFLAFMVGTIIFAEETIKKTQAKELTAREILEKTDAQNDTRDQFSQIKMTLIDKSSKESSRKVTLWTKGDRKRLIKFLAPADVKGVGFLVLDADTPEEKMYLYLPAYKKIRRIAGSAKRGSFMGTDFSYDDIGSSNYSQDYDPERLPDEEHQFVLELKKKKDSEVGYDKLIAWISPEVFVPTKVEFYKIKRVEEKESFELAKIMTVEKIENIKKYWMPTELIMENIDKEHKTILELDQIEVDRGLSDELFTLRYLQR